MDASPHYYASSAHQLASTQDWLELAAHVGVSNKPSSHNGSNDRWRGKRGRIWPTGKILINPWDIDFSSENTGKAYRGDIVQLM